MYYLIFLLFSFFGHISRGSFWLGTIITLILLIGGGTILQPAAWDLEAKEIQLPNLAANIWSLVFFISFMTITVKRLNDRNWPIFLSVIVWMVSLPFTVGPLFGVLAVDFNNYVSQLEIFAWILYIVLGIFLLIDNGFLRGTSGPNRYGPDPLSKS